MFLFKHWIFSPFCFPPFGITIIIDIFWSLCIKLQWNILFLCLAICLVPTVHSSNSWNMFFSYSSSFYFPPQRVRPGILYRVFWKWHMRTYFIVFPLFNLFGSILILRTQKGRGWAGRVRTKTLFEWSRLSYLAYQYFGIKLSDWKINSVYKQTKLNNLTSFTTFIDKKSSYTHWCSPNSPVQVTTANWR